MAYRTRSREIISGLEMSAGVTGKERARLIFLFVAMAGVTVAMLGGFDTLLAGFRRKPATGPVIDGGPPVEKIDVVENVVPWTLDPKFIESRISEATEADRVKEYPEALREIAEHVRGRPHVNFLLDPAYRESRGFLTPDVSEVLAAPGKFRGKPLEFVGTLESADLVDTKDEFGVDLNYQFASQWSGTVRVESAAGPARLVSFLFLDDGAGEDPRRDLLGRRVKLQGVFYRLRDLKVGASFETSVFALGKRLVRALWVPALKAPPPDLKSRIDDATVERQRTVYDDEFYAAFGYAASNPPEELLAASPPTPIKHGDLWPMADEYRLKTVRFDGVVLRVAYEPFEYGGRTFELVRPTDAIATGWYTVYVAAPNAQALYVVGMKDRPDGFAVGSHVELDGVFFKRLVFANKGASDPAAAPPGFDPSQHGQTKAAIVFAVGPLREVRPPPQREMQPFMLGVMVVAAVAALGIALVVRRDRKIARELGDHLRRHKGARLRSSGVDLTSIAKTRLPGGKGPGK
jgi:hypothetical protein